MAPTLTASVTPVVFSPNGDGWQDGTVLRWAGTERVYGSMVIRRGSTPIRRWPFSGATGGAVHWTGLDSSGHRVPEGAYTMWLDFVDAAGNRSIVTRPIVVDRTAGFLRWSATSFYPQDGDALRPASRVSFRLIRAATTSLVIVDAAGHVVRTAWVNRSLASGSWGWTWNGRLTSGAWAPVGQYSAVLTVASRFATTTLRRSVFAGAFTVTTSATTLRAGQTLTLTIRTVEPLASRPVVVFDQAGLAPVERTSTLISTGLYRVSFRVGAGGSGTAAIGIRARDTAGGTNRTSLTVLVL
jgi:hypothetical protein